MPLLQLKNSQARGGDMPFASYAQLIRMLVPPAHRVSFYDAKARALWINDGVEEPDFRMHLDLVMARFAANRPDESHEPYIAEDQAEPIYVFAVRDSTQTLLGAIGIVCREVPTGAAYRRFDHVERLLSPVIEVLSHSWQPQGVVGAPIPAAIRESKPRETSGTRGDEQPTTPLPALLRRTLALASRSLDCSFGAIVAAERPFTLNHRVSPDESDLAINAVVDSVRRNVLRWMTTRNEPLLVNTAGAAGRSSQLPYKLLALPLRAGPNRLAAVIMLFRDKNGRDFGTAEIAALAQIAAQLPANSLADWVPKRPALNARTTVTRNPKERVPRIALVESPQPEVLSAPDQKAKIAARVAALTGLPISARIDPAQALAPRQDLRLPEVTPTPKPLAAQNPQTMDERIRAALRDGGFSLYVQKIAPLRESQHAGRFEVLLRMSDGEGLHTPNAFFAAAEAGELMPDLDRWVIRELMTTLRKKAIAMRTSCWEFSVNIAAQSLITEGFGEFVAAEVSKSSIPANLLVFEISESDAIEHQYSLSILAKRLHQIGCRIALDNCRAGLRTFDSVQKWPVSCVKIDGSLIRNVVSNCRYESQVRAVAKLATEMGIETVAECVETEKIRDKVFHMGVDFAQGFHFGRPRPLATLFR